MIMCNRPMDDTHSVVVGPATDALERSRKRRRTEEHPTKNTSEEPFYLQDIYTDLVENYCHREESFPSIEWSDDDSDVEDYTSALEEHSSLSNTHLFLHFPKHRDNGLRRSKSFRSDLAGMNNCSRSVQKDLFSLVPSTIEPYSFSHLSKHAPPNELKSLSTSTMQSLAKALHEERFHPLNIA